MFNRIIEISAVLKRKSLFLLGPRQTGKSTYLKLHFPEALYINLLKNSEYQSYLKNPSQLEDVVRYHLQHSNNKIVIIDEIQKLPALLDEVHDLIEKNKELRFILTGSSARKLKHGGANLLGGRASWFRMHPLCYAELGTDRYSLWMKGLSVGKLPAILLSSDPVSDLKDYVGLYLKEEVQAEGLTRSIENFSRFLDFAALMNGEQINYTSIANDAQVSPTTAREYFEILSDTLIGLRLHSFQATVKRKAVATDKFYLFDCGIAASLLQRKEVPAGTPEFGKHLEQALFLELRTYLDYKKIDKKIEYWRSTTKFEIDFLIYETKEQILGIEVKATKNPSRKDFKGFKAFEEEYKLARKILVCQIEKPQLTADGIELLPISIFLEKLWADEII